MRPLSYEAVRKAFDYVDGQLVKRSNGKPAGKRHHTCYRVTVDGYRHARARVVWVYFNKVLPSKQIGHIDGDNFNDSIENLKSGYEYIRPSARLDAKKARALGKNINGHPPFRGVRYDKRSGKYKAFYRSKKGYTPLGSYSEYDLAVLARLTFESEQSGKSGKVEYYENESC